MHTQSSTLITFLILFPLLGWRIYRRIRRTVGRQRLTTARPWITLVVYALLLTWLAFVANAHAERLGALAGGVGLGALLGVFGLKKTRFESTPEGLFYTPNAHLGIALSLLFVGRMAYRFLEIYAPQTPDSHGSDFGSSPLTLAVFGLLAGYYVTYAIGLIRWRIQVQAAKGSGGS